jgi:hypothetical protein
LAKAISLILEEKHPRLKFHQVHFLNYGRMLSQVSLTEELDFRLLASLPKAMGIVDAPKIVIAKISLIDGNLSVADFETTPSSLLPEDYQLDDPDSHYFYIGKHLLDGLVECAIAEPSQIKNQ